MVSIAIKLLACDGIDVVRFEDVTNGKEARERAKKLLKNAPFAYSVELEYTINGIKQQFKINKPK